MLEVLAAEVVPAFPAGCLQLRKTGSSELVRHLCLLQQLCDSSRTGRVMDQQFEGRLGRKKTESRVEQSRGPSKGCRRPLGKLVVERKEEPGEEGASVGTQRSSRRSTQAAPSAASSLSSTLASLLSQLIPDTILIPSPSTPYPTRAITSPPNPLLTASLPSTHPCRLCTNATSPSVKPGTNLTLAPLTNRSTSSGAMKTLRLGLLTRLIFLSTGRSARYLSSAQTRFSDVRASRKEEGSGRTEEEVEVEP